MSSSSSSPSGDAPQSSDQQSGEKKRGRPHKPCNRSKGGCGRMPTEETARECARCATTLRNRRDKQNERRRNAESGSSKECAAKKNRGDGAQLVDQARQLAANAMYQLVGCDHCSPVLQQLEEELAGLLGDFIEPDPLNDDVGVEDIEEEPPVLGSASAEAALSGVQIVTTTEIYSPPQPLYSASSSTIEGQFAVYSPPTSSSLQHYVGRASTGDAAQIIAAFGQESAVTPNDVPPLSTQLLATNITLPIDVTNAFEQLGLFPVNFFGGDQLRINEVFQKAAEALYAFEKQGKFFPFLTPANFRFTLLPPNQTVVTKGRYTGFAVLVEIVDTGETLQEAMSCPATRRLLAPEILAGHPPTTTSGSWSFYRMYYDALKSKVQLIQTTADNTYHFIEYAVMKKGPAVEKGWWELNPHITAALYGGLFHGPQGQRLGIEAFVRPFQRTNDRRYLDSRICVDAFEGQQYCLLDTPWFSD